MTIFPNDTQYQTTQIFRHLVVDDELTSFAQNLRKLTGALDAWVDLSPDWQEVISRIRISIWRLRNDPNSSSSNQDFELLLKPALRVLGSLQNQISAELRDMTNLLIMQGEKVLARDESSLSRFLIETFAQTKTKSNFLVVKKQKTQTNTENWIARSPMNAWTAVTPDEYRKVAPIAETTLVLGVTGDYPRHIFTGIQPKSGMHLVSFSDIPEKKVILGPLSEIGSVTLQIAITTSGLLPATNSVNSDFQSDYLDPVDELNRNLVNKLARRNVDQLGEIHEDQTVPCRCLLLTAGRMIYLPVDDSSVNILDPNAAEGSRVSRMQGSSVTIGTLVLLRIGESDTEAIRSMADTIAGSEAGSLRKSQSAWKEALGLKLKENGLARVVSDLRALGIARPWPKAWVLQDTIRPQQDQTFKILLDYLGIPVAKTISNMNRLRQLHLAAGFRFREILKEEFERVDLESLKSDGYIELEVDYEGSVARLGAYYCLAVSEDTYEIPEFWVKKVLDNEGGLEWQE